VNNLDVRILTKELGSESKTAEEETFSACSGSVDGEVSFFFFFWKCRIKTGCKQSDFVILEQETRNQIFKNIFHAPSMRRIVVKQDEELWFVSQRGMMKR
jgi:hypothetical protein